MSISFPALLIYLLPGFLGLWVFKNIVQEDLNKRGESTQIAIALLLGISAIACLCMINFLLSFSPVIAEYFSPEALQTAGSEGDAFLKWDAKFWVSYLVLCGCAMLSAAFWAWLRGKDYGLTWIFSDLVNKSLKRGEQRPCESAMRALIDEMRKNGHEPSLMRVYSLIGNLDNSLIGWWDGYSESENEVKLSLLECCDATEDLHKDFDLQTRRCVVNYGSGIVVEFLDLDETQAESFKKYVIASYSKNVHPRGD